MKKLISLLAAFCVIGGMLGLSASAQNRVTTIDIDAVLQKDGSCEITQVWKGNFDKDTECYYPFNTGDDLEIVDFTVKDQNKTYKTLKSWDPSADFEEKAGRCGLNQTDDGVEVCWGITQYGQNTYTVYYKVLNMLAAYQDEDGFNFRFINSGMNTGPTKATLKLTATDGTKFSDDNANIWGFGFQGQVQFTKDGGIEAFTETDLNPDAHLTVMASFNKGIFTPTKAVADSFSTVRDLAFEGSDYDNADDDEEIGIIFAILGCLVGGAFLFALVVLLIRKKRFNTFYKSVPFWHDLPNGGDLEKNYYLARRFSQCRDGSIIGARILKLMLSGSLQPQTENSVGAFGKTKEELSFVLTKAPSANRDPNSLALYEILKEAAGSDGVLQQKELEKYCKKNYSRVRAFLDKSEMDGGTGFTFEDTRQFNSGNIKKLSDGAKAQLAELLGYKKYLLEYSLIGEKSVLQTYIFEDMLVIATLLGIADKVLAQMKEIYPDRITEIEQYEYNTTMAGCYYGYMFHAMSAGESEARSAGSGGSSSFGGGGGFSGGGSGGGTR